jgi:hypothetical protein
VLHHGIEHLRELLRLPAVQLTLRPAESDQTVNRPRVPLPAAIWRAFVMV